MVPLERWRDSDPMCGIAGLYAKTIEAQDRLGADLAGMLLQLADRGPDSSGVAIYRPPAPPGTVKVSLLDARGAMVDWEALAAQLSASLGTTWPLARFGDQGVLATEADPDAARSWLTEHRPGLLVLSMGARIETFKRVGRPEALLEATGLAMMSATHGLGHTRMATESRITTEHSHPFSTGPDLCLVHNGSLSNHNRLRRDLTRRGIRFQTDNDSEVAAGYLTWRMAEGATLEAALEAGLADLDGFFTFAVGTGDGFAVVRDGVACKPAILAETDDWVAVASEHRAIAGLPGAADAELWEPEPGRVYGWSREPVAA